MWKTRNFGGNRIQLNCIYCNKFTKHIKYILANYQNFAAKNYLEMFDFISFHFEEE